MRIDQLVLPYRAICDINKYQIRKVDLYFVYLKLMKEQFAYFLCVCRLVAIISKKNNVK